MAGLRSDDVIKKAASELGYQTLRLKQLVRVFVSGHDVFVSLPLMQDQVKSLRHQ